MPVATVKCDCSGPAAEFQEKQIGKPGYRYANTMVQDGKARCTVCGKEHGGVERKKKKSK